MTPEKICAVIEMYERELVDHLIPKRRISPSRSFAWASQTDLLAHAHFLCADAKVYAKNPEKYGKANRHLTAIQMCLSFATWYTLEELMEHNSSK